MPASRRTTSRPQTRRVAGARRQPATAGAPADSLPARTPAPLAAPQAGAAGPAPTEEVAPPDTGPAATPAGSTRPRDALAAAPAADADVADADVADAEVADAEVADAEVADAEVADAEVADAEVADAEVACADVADAEVARADGLVEPTPPESADQPAVRRPGPGPLPRPRTTRAAKPAATDAADPDTTRKGRIAAPGGARVRRLWIATAVLAAVAVAFGILATGWLSSYRDAQARDSAWQRALPAAKENVARLFSYDYRHIQADRNSVATLLTGQFRTDYLSSMDKLVIPQAPGKKFVLVSTTQSAGVSSVAPDGHQAVVIVFLNQAISNTDVKARTDLVRLRVTMTLVAGRWLISEVKSV